MHADVVADALFGRVNRWGKSVLTVGAGAKLLLRPLALALPPPPAQVYPHAYQDAISLYSFDSERQRVL